MKNLRRAPGGFTLVELVVVIAIISILAAILLPVFQTARRRAFSTVCTSNLRQIGMGIEQYSQDYDGQYPNGDDPTDKYSSTWSTSSSSDQQAVQAMPLLNSLMLPYITSPKIWQCPNDIGYTYIDINGIPFNTTPSSYDKYGMSYLSRTEITFYHIPLDSITAHDNATPPNQYGNSQINLIMDGCGGWHGDNIGFQELRYNVLMGDGHAVSMNSSLYQTTWNLTINH